jgi:hypothetical protein
MLRHRRAFSVALAAVCVFVLARPARAYEEQASLDLTAGALFVPGAKLPGAGAEVALGGALGISDMFVARALFGYAALFESGEVTNLGRARVEAAYLLDVLQVVPFFGLGASLWLYREASAFQARPGVHALVGLDYLWSRTWTFGLDVRVGVLFEPGKVSNATDVQLRISRMFDLF